MINALGTVTHQASCRASTPINPCQDVGNVELVSYTAGGIICNTSSFVMSWKWRSRATLIRLCGLAVACTAVAACTDAACAPGYQKSATPQPRTVVHQHCRHNTITRFEVCDPLQLSLKVQQVNSTLSSARHIGRSQPARRDGREPNAVPCRAAANHAP